MVGAFGLHWPQRSLELRHLNYDNHGSLPELPFTEILRG